MSKASHRGSDDIADSFKRRADSSAFFEAWVGAMLSRQGLFTYHHPFTLASETGNPLSFYANTWDLDVTKDGIVYTPVEVKSVNLKFVEPNDYPHLGLLVCSEANWAKKWPYSTETRRDFLMVSRLTGGIVWLPVGTTVDRKEVTDNTRGETYWCKTAKKSDLRPLAAFVQHVQSTGAQGH